MKSAVSSSNKAYDVAESKKKKKSVQPKRLIKKTSTWLLFS